MICYECRQEKELVIHYPFTLESKEFIMDCQSPREAQICPECLPKLAKEAERLGVAY